MWSVIGIISINQFENFNSFSLRSTSSLIHYYLYRLSTSNPSRIFDYGNCLFSIFIVNRFLSIIEQSMLNKSEWIEKKTKKFCSSKQKHIESLQQISEFGLQNNKKKLYTINEVCANQSIMILDSYHSHNNLAVGIFSISKLCFW